MKIRVLALVLFYTFTVLPCYAQTTNMSNGITWLVASQNEDGSYGTNSSAFIVYTTEVVNTLKIYGNSTGLQNASAWLLAQSPSDVDELARSVVSLSNIGIDTSDAVTMLAAMRNPEIGWGYQIDYVSTPLDTSLALQALHASNYPDLSISNNALAYLTNNQNPDGGWGFSSGDDSSIVITAMVSTTLQQFPQTPFIANAITKASGFLTTVQNIDGGFGVTVSGTSASSVYETALSYIALIGDGQTQGLPLQKTLNYITSTQATNGSWNNDPYSTALALRALYLSENKPAAPPSAMTTGAIMGTVVDGTTNLPLAGVIATLADNPAISATSNATGTFVLSGISNGIRQITLGFAGYAQQSITATINAGDFINVGNISLLAVPTSGTVQGVVWDAEVNAPYPDVSVRVQSGNTSYDTLSGLDGSYRIPNVPPGSVTLSTPSGPKTGYYNVSVIENLPPRGILVYNPRMSKTVPNHGLFIRTAKTIYKSGDSVALTVDVQNVSSAAYSATLKIHVTGPTGTNVYDSSVDVTLPASALLTQNASFVMPITAHGGSYTVLAELFSLSGTKLVTATSTLDLQIIPIVIAPRLPARFAEGVNSIAFDLVNNRNTSVSSGGLAISMKDPDGQVVFSSSQPFSLAPGENKTLTYTLPLPVLKFGTYTLSYTQSDEVTDGQASAISLPNSINLGVVFDKYSYKKGETANLAISMNNTGRFDVGNMAVTVAVPDAGYADTKNVSIAAGATQNQQENIALPDTVTSGAHSSTVTLALSGGSSISRDVPCLVSQAILGVVPADGSRDVPVRASILVRLSEKVDSSSWVANMGSLSADGVAVPGTTRFTADGSALLFKPLYKLAYASVYTFSIKAPVRDLSGNSTVIDLTTTFSTPMADPDLVGYWPMDGDWKDYSGYGNDGTAYGSSAFADGRVPGVSSGNFVIDSHLFDGSGGYVPTSAKFIDYMENSFTMSFWAKPTATRESTPETSEYYVLGEGEQRFAIAPVNMYDLGYLGATAGVSVGTNGVSVFEETTISGFLPYMPSLLVYDAPVPLTDWTHVAVVYNDRQPSLYLNGVPVKTGQTSKMSQVFPAAVFAFGNERPTGAYSGQLAGVAYHDRALSAGEIQSLYQAQVKSAPQISITSAGQSVNYRPGDAGSATVSVNSATGITELHCSASGATTSGAFAINFDPPQTSTTQQLDFQVSSDAAPYAPIVVSCAAQTVEGVFGVVDLQLQAADLVAPVVVDTIPANNAVDVSATMPVTINFSEAMDPASIVSRNTFKFQRTDNGAWVTGSFGMSTDKKSLFMLPSPPLDSSTPYTVTLSGVRDLAGNALASDFTLHFTTLQQTTLSVTNQGTPASPYVLPAGRYGTLTLTNSYVTANGGVIVDTLTMDHSTLNIDPSGSVPGNLGVAYGDMVLANGSQANVNGTLTLSANLSLTNSTLGITGAGTVPGNVAMDNSTLTLKNPLQVAGDVTLHNNSILTHFEATATDTAKLDVSAANLVVDASSKVDVTGKGYLGGFQPGNDDPRGFTLGNTRKGGTDQSSGGSYGGVGGDVGDGPVFGANAVYGDLANPNELGSGGGGVVFEIDNVPGGNGGGLIRLHVGTLSVDGIITADGEDSFIGGGSGGGIRIDADRISGAGRITAKGGASAGYGYERGGGGSGGRIAILYSSLTLPVANIVATGGRGTTDTAFTNGGAGTVFLKDSAIAKPGLIIDNGGVVTNHFTPVPGGVFESVDVKGGAVVSGNYIVGEEFYYFNTEATFGQNFTFAGDLLLQNTTFTADGAINVRSLSITNSQLQLKGINVDSLVSAGSNVTVDGNLAVSGNLTLDGSNVAVSGPINVASAVSLNNGSVLSHFVATTTRSYKLDVTAGTVTIDATSKIDVSGKGYLGGRQGNNNSDAARTFDNALGSSGNSGGSYGGLGGYFASPPNAVYGSIQVPNENGSGGAGSIGTNVYPGGNGGGLLKLTANSLNLAGSILAEGGADSGSAGGSGGGILLNVGDISGTGTISAKGGLGGDGGGGGGRIAIFYGTDTLPTSGITAAGGKGSDGNNPDFNGGTGTIYLKDNAKTKGEVYYDNGGLTTSNTTAVVAADGVIVSVAGGTKISVAGDISFDRDVVLTGSNVTFLGSITISGSLILDQSTVTFNGALTTSGGLTLDGSNVTANGPVNVANDLVLKNGSVLSHPATTTTASYKLDVTAGTIAVDATSRIDVSGKGYLGGRQGDNNSDTARTFDNALGSSGNSGGSYGGLGAYFNSPPNAVYGSIQMPNENGSGGAGSVGTYVYPGGNGGGLVKLTANSLSLAGNILADGGAGSAGGSGGGILLNVGVLSGNGTISAKGGLGGDGGGGGGRIAILYGTDTLPASGITAAGGKGTNENNPDFNGGAGTIYLKDNAKAKGNVYVDNGDLPTSNITSVAGGDYGTVSITAGAKISIAGDISFDGDVVLTGSNVTFNGGITMPGSLTLDGSNVTANGPVNIANDLVLKNGSVMSHSSATTTASFKLDVTAGTITVDATSMIDVSSKGYLGGRQGGNNNDTAQTVNNAAGSSGLSGGSYGGLGAYFIGPPNAVYGSIQMPNENGSGGAGSVGTYSYPGGNGGGLVKLTANSLSLAGSILANGGTSSWSAGGSGGGILLNVGTLSGSGFISAKGGSGGDSGGGGGRIAINYDLNSLPANNISDSGGHGCASDYNGGAGTIYLHQNTMSLTVTKAGSGTGVVLSAPAGIACGASCSGNFAKNGSVSLTATPDSGSIFSGWSGPCSGTGGCTLSMGMDLTVGAVFTFVPPPTVAIASPSGIVNNNKPTLTYNVSGGTVVVKVDGVVVNKVSGSTLDTLTDGSHQIQVTSTNGAGSVGSATTTVIIDTLPPALSVSALATPLRTPSLTLSGTAEAGAAVNVSTTSGATIGPVSISAGTWSCAVGNLAPGLNAFTVTAIDLAGNVSSATVSTTYIPTVAISLTASSIAAGYQGPVGITVTNILPTGSTVLIEQFIDTNRNGSIDAGDFVVRSFNVTDGAVAAIPGTPGDEDGTVNGSISTALAYFLTDDLYHAPGNYIFRVTNGTYTASMPFTVTPVSQLQTVSGMIGDGTGVIPGALIRLEDKWRQPVAWSIADGSGTYVLNVRQPGTYYLTPVLYGCVAQATPITVAAGQNLSDRNLTVTAGTHRISGTVIDAVSSVGIGGVWVQAEGADTTAFAVTGADGAYALMLPAGQYAINTLGNATVPGTSAKGYVNFDRHPLNVNVTGNAAGYTIALSDGNVQAGGQVLDHTGTPVPGLPVTGKMPGTVDVRVPASYAVTDATGAFSLGLFAGTGWNIGVDNSAARSLGYLGTISGNLSTASGPPVGQNLTVQPITGWIQGTVTDSTSKLLPGIEVQLHNADSSVVASVFTASDGTYSLGAYAGTWYLDALTTVQGLPAVPEQTVTLTEAQTVPTNFIVDVTPPSVTVYAVPVVSTTSLPDGYLTTAYSQTLAVTGGKAPFTWSLNSGTLPAGLTLNTSTGAITGTPTATGTGTVTFKVRDANGISSTVSSTITIAVDIDGILITAQGKTRPDIRDALRVLQIASGQITPTANDMNHADIAPLGKNNKPKGDGVIDIYDVIGILRMVVGLL